MEQAHPPRLHLMCRFRTTAGWRIWPAPALMCSAWIRRSSAEPPAALPAEGVAMNTQSHDEFIANWDRQIGCSEQYDPSAAESVWSKMIESDPVGATWGPGVRRAPQTTTWGWNQSVVTKS